jgi:RimJ/RimL family protein N-acetyltransferase
VDETVRLRDGEKVSLRPIEAGDRERLRRAFDRLGPESRYRRFFSPVDHLTESQLDFLTQVDHHDHEALVAVQDGEIRGVARYVRPKPGSPRAEVAVVVGDDWQGRGLGTELLDALSRRARADGVHTFTAAALSNNRAIIDLLGGLGATVKRQAGAGQVELEIELEGEDSLRELMRHAASGAVHFAERIRSWRP